MGKVLFSVALLPAQSRRQAATCPARTCAQGMSAKPPAARKPAKRSTCALQLFKRAAPVSLRQSDSSHLVRRPSTYAALADSDSGAEASSSPLAFSEDMYNPYATALEGLEFEDPVKAFFDFCREREQVRERRESGAPAPWSDDPIFQQARFLNVFREDDRGSKAVMRFAEAVGGAEAELGQLLHALLFARWCNKQATLDALLPLGPAALLADPPRLHQAAEEVVDQPWCNVAAYPVEAVRVESRLYSRLAAATELFLRLRPQLAAAVAGAGGDVIAASRAVNRILGMENDFAVFMAVMDVAWFRPDVIDPASHVPTGIGAVAFLDILQRHLGAASHQETSERMAALQAEYWPEARRPLLPIDIEYLSCETRKYYSYVNGTKEFEGKNVFQPGMSAQYTFDVPDVFASPEPVVTQICVIAGGPCSGKSTLIAALKADGVWVEGETAERLIQEGVAAGRSVEEMKAEPVAFQEDLLRRDFALFDGLPADALVATDTSFLETVVFSRRAGVAEGPGLQRWIRSKRYRHVFFLDPLQYEETAVRQDGADAALQISAEVRACYAEYGYEVIPVPAMPVEDRLAFIKSYLPDAA